MIGTMGIGPEGHGAAPDAPMTPVPRGADEIAVRVPDGGPALFPHCSSIRARRWRNHCDINRRKREDAPSSV